MNISKEILDSIEWESYPKKEKPGGQITYNIIYGVTLKINGLFEVSINEYKSQIKNKQLCMDILEWYLILTNSN
jgi:hypothetical protein